MAKKQTQQKNDGGERSERKKYSWKHQLFRLPLLLLIPLGIFLPRLVQNSPEQVERIYSRGVYPVIARVLGYISSRVSFSLAELVIVTVSLTLAAILIVRTVRVIFGKLANRRRNRIRLISYIISLGIFAGAMLTAFHCVWGFNYYRLPAATLLSLDVKKRSANELEQLCIALAEEAAELRENLDEDENGVFTIGDHAEAKRAVVRAYETLGESNALFKNNIYPAKSVFLSDGLSHLDIAGIYIPYTAEANINVGQPDLYVLSGAAHETAHYLGFAREDEANYFAFYASCFSDDLRFRYSAVMMALSYSAGELNSVNSEAFSELYENVYTTKMKRDIWNYNDYYRKYEKKQSNRIGSNINDSYLKFNGQDDGIKSYGRMVDLLLAYFAANGGL